MTDETALEKCKYKNPNGLACQRERLSIDNDFCVFHQGCNRKSSEELPPNLLFQSAFDLLLEQQDGMWDGFIFPSDFKVPNEIKFPVYLRYANFAVFDQSDTTFEATTDFSDTIFSGNVIFRRVTFKSEVKFERCRFEAGFELQSTYFEKSASFHQAEFSKRAVFRAHFVGSCNLSLTTFREGVKFAGWNIAHGNINIALPSITISSGVQSTKLTVYQRIKMQFKQTREKVCRYVKMQFKQTREKVNNSFHQVVRKFSTKNPGVTIIKVFEGDAMLQDVIFVKPDQVSFSQVDLSRVDFSGTNLRGVRFLAVNWWQPKLSRNGLYEELAIRFSNDGFHQYQYLPALEQTCRNIRVSLEESRDFNVASDFYIAEMEAIRARLPFIKRHFFSVVAWYNFVSYYGTNVARGLRVLAYLIILHLGLNLLIHAPETIAQCLDDALRTVKILSLQIISHEDQVNLTDGQHWIDAIFRILAPIQIAMLVLAFRTRIKRS